MSNTLYIIGNGFDIHHGLHTSYQSFGVFLKENYPEIYRLLNDYFGLSDLDPHSSASANDPRWKDFETALADLDFESVLASKSDYAVNVAAEDFSDGDWDAWQIEMESVIDKLTKHLYAAFKAFILSVSFPDSVQSKLLALEKDGIFLNFNYTDTLEKYYGISPSQINYIHGRAKSPSDVTVLGHAMKRVIPPAYENAKPPAGLDDEELEAWREQQAEEYDLSYERAYYEIAGYFDASLKPTEDIIKANQSFFNSLADVKCIVVLGHSVSPVDQPYFQKITKVIAGKNVHWTATYYDPNEISSIRGALESLGIQRSQINMVQMNSLKAII